MLNGSDATESVRPEEGHDVAGRGRKQREHRPHELGPRVFRDPRSRWWKVDLRPWGGKRMVMRNPDDPGWPDLGERTELEEVANRWQAEYHALALGEHRRRVLGLGPAPRSLGVAVEGFLEHRRRTTERATWSASRTATAHLLRFFPTGMHTSSLNGPTLQELVDSLIDEGYEASTIDLYARTWRVFLEWCAFGTCGQVLRDTPTGRARLREFYDPVSELSIPAIESGDVITFSDDDIRVLFDAARKVDAQQTGNFPSAEMAVGLGLFMGLRQGEIFATRWQDIRTQECTIRVQWQVPKDRLELKTLKGDRSRTALVLPGWWDLHRSDAVGFVCGRPGKPVGTRTQRNLITRILDTAGLNRLGLGWHVLRHTYARLFVEGGGRMEELQKSLGHGSIVTTETTYGHFHADVAAKLARERIYGS